MSFTPFMLRGRPDQTVRELNLMQNQLNNLQNSIRIISGDGKQCIIIGNQPANPATGKPYDFGIHMYKLKGDKIELEE